MSEDDSEILTQPIDPKLVCDKCGDEKTEFEVCVNCKRLINRCRCNHRRIEAKFLCEVCDDLR
jgi:hypothetical protein